MDLASNQKILSTINLQKIFEFQRMHFWSIMQKYFRNVLSNIGCLNMHETHLTANNSTNNNVVFFFVSDLKQNIKTTINPRSQCLEQERKNILRHYLFGDKIIQNCLKIDATH